jgi:superfamily II DNA helicase RecQ
MLLQKHMLRSVLSVSHPVIIQETYTKPNLVYIVKYKDNKLCDNIVEEVKGYDCSIVYCSTRCDCENMCAKLCARGVNAKAYHGDMSKSLKEDCFQRWISGDIKCLVSTKAFGMGVDKPDVRAVIHMPMPSSMEDYYQETGRGGRDGLPCRCILFSVH